MKHIRKLTIILAVLLLCTAFVGAGAAFTYSSSDLVITPSGALTPGQTVTATMTIKITGGSLTDNDRIILSTPLSNPKWSTEIYKGGQSVSKKTSSTIYGFDINYDTDITLKISLSGVVSSASKGKDISVLKITATSKETNGYTSFTSKTQKVYDASNYANDLSALNTAITNLEKRSATYAGYGADVSAVNETIKQAKNKYSAAKSAGTENLVPAYANIEAGETYAEKGERALALAGLNAASKNIGKINSIAVTLYDRGWDSEALYLETKAVSLKCTYEILSDTYKDGETPSASKMDSFMGDVQKTLKRANEYFPVYGEDPEMPLPYNLTLKDGWNFIAVPKVLTAESAVASTFFDGVDTADNAILEYNAEIQDWKQVTASAVIKPLTGYWIYSNGTVDVPLSYVTDPSVPAVKQLYSGWNAVGVSADCAVPAASFLAGTPWRVALPWNLDAGNWKNAIVNGGSSVNSAEQYLTLGNGIWVYAESEGTLIGLTA